MFFILFYLSVLDVLACFQKNDAERERKVTYIWGSCVHLQTLSDRSLVGSVQQQKLVCFASYWSKIPIY